MTHKQTKPPQAHTPGPWLYDGTVTKLGAPIWKPTHGWICVVPKSPQTDANARLIASAPELLEAAKAALVCLDQVAGADRIGIVLSKAIIKAEGRV